jgi:glutathionylspermidine synthase
MERISITARDNWQEIVEIQGFGYHTPDVLYWDETAYYSFGPEEIDGIEKATGELWEMCLDAVQHVIDKHLYPDFHIPEQFAGYIERSWTEDYPALYGRFDLAYNQGQLKLLEFNADTPTSLFEAGIIQWLWLQDFNKEMDQFNSIHERLVGHWRFLIDHLRSHTIHFTCLKQTLEDLTNLEYIRDCAIQAGLDTKLVFLDDIGWNPEIKVFVDLENLPIKSIFKLYPWEWLIGDEFGPNLLSDKNESLWIEPAWKMILSNKAILPVLWKLFPDHPHLLPAYICQQEMNQYVKKPLLSREGSNVEIVVNGIRIQATGGEYGMEGFIYQEYFPLPDFDQNYPVIGSWVIGQYPAGIGIRESRNLITDNFSRFIPHLIRG